MDASGGDCFACALDRPVSIMCRVLQRIALLVRRWAAACAARSPDCACCAGETQRKRQLVENDPVRTVKLSAWVKEQFQQAERVHGQNLSNAINALGAPVADPLRAMWA